EAERRGQVYDRQGATYLFDLDYVEDVYTVDAAHYGNISHFVNHSCDPNLQVYNVFIENLDQRLPRIALFATRPIRAGEELTFDYNMHGTHLGTPGHTW
ncbi:histone-lysine N-methyltransferase SUV39H1-like, partial [Corapipo altera]|uniref:histone-lysine N-methyltransferase SUV39H1-like n=1 Tax=Corapipo altera TaxID=415028 RepID=UPI000FD67F7B